MNRSYLDILIGMLTLILCLVVQLFMHPLPLLVQFPSGVAFLATVMYSQYVMLRVLISDHFKLPARVALSITAYLSATIFIGILLNFTPAGLTRTTWLLSYTVLASLSFVFTTIARLRYTQSKRTRPGFTAYQYVLVFLAIGLFVGSFIMVQVGIRLAPGGELTQFWLIQDKTIPESEGVILKMGIYNAEKTTQDYFIQLRSRQNVLATWEIPQLRDNQTWEIDYTIPPAGIVYPLIAELFIPEQETPYRMTEFWLNETPLPTETDG